MVGVWESLYVVLVMGVLLMGVVPMPILLAVTILMEVGVVPILMQQEPVVPLPQAQVTLLRVAHLGAAKTQSATLIAATIPIQ